MLNVAVPVDARVMNPTATSGWRYYLPNVLVLLGALLVSVQFQLKVLTVTPPATLAEAQPLAAFVVVTLAALLARSLLRPLRWRVGPARLQFAALLLGIGLSTVGLRVLTPQMPQTLLAFFILAGAGLGCFVILLRARLTRGRQRPDAVTSSIQLWRQRYLIKLWVRNNVRARYSQAVLGVIWVVLLPLAQAIIMALVFSQILRVPVGDVPYVSFYMAALVPWAFINNSVMQGAVSVVNNMNLISQVYFPREILVLVKLGETAVDALFTFAALVVINLVLGIPPNFNWVYLPLLILIIFVGTFGMCLFLSVFTVYVRDVPQLTFVIMQLVFYLSPILYPVEFIPQQLRFIVMLNPLVPLIQGFRDVLVLDKPVDLVTLYYPIVFAAALLFAGYSYFKAYERRLTDHL